MSSSYNGFSSKIFKWMFDALYVDENETISRYNLVFSKSFSDDMAHFVASFQCLFISLLYEKLFFSSCIFHNEGNHLALHCHCSFPCLL